VAVGASTIFLPIYAVASLVEDENKLAYYRDSGPWRDFRNHWDDVWTVAQAALRQNQWPGSSIRLRGIPFVDGWMTQVNFLNFKQWMARPHGVGISYDAAGNSLHAKYGIERGYFIGDYQAGAGEEGLITTPVMRYPIGTLSRGLELASDSKVRPDLAYPQDARGTAQWQADFREGREASNVFAYVHWMREPRGLNQSNTSHLIFGRTEGRFVGDAHGGNEDVWTYQDSNGRQVERGGRLDYAGKTWAWRDFP
jgi:hypothetical protein